MGESELHSAPPTAERGRSAKGAPVDEIDRINRLLRTSAVRVCGVWQDHRGEGPRVAWPCPQCKGQVFGLTVAFIFWDAVFDLADEPDWPLQEFFNVVLSFPWCFSCGHLSEPTDFGEL